MIVVAEIFSFHVSRRVFILRAAMLLFSLTYFRHTENKTATRKADSGRDRLAGALSGPVGDQRFPVITIWCASAITYSEKNS